MNKDNSDKIVDWYFSNGGKENSFLKVSQGSLSKLFIEIGQGNVFVGYWEEEEELIPDTVVGWELQAMKSQIFLGPRYPDDQEAFVDKFVEQVLERLDQAKEGMLFT